VTWLLIYGELSQFQLRRRYLPPVLDFSHLDSVLTKAQNGEERIAYVNQNGKSPLSSRMMQIKKGCAEEGFRNSLRGKIETESRKASDWVGRQ